MRISFISLLLILSFFCSKGSTIKDVFKKYFRGIEFHGFTSNDFKLIEGGVEFRKDNLVSISSFRYSSDNLYKSFGLSTTGQWYFPIIKIKSTPFLQFNLSSNHSESKSDLKTQKEILNNISLFAGGGIFLELNKSFQIGSSINYEMIGIFGQPVYFKVRPMFHLKYEFHFI